MFINKPSLLSPNGGFYGKDILLYITINKQILNVIKDIYIYENMFYSFVVLLFLKGPVVS